MIISSSRLYLGLTLVGMVVAAVASTPPVRAQAGKAFIVQTNSAGDSIHLIDPATDKIVAEVPDEEVVHGIAAAPDGSRFYATNESTITLDVIDARTLRVIKKIPLTGPP